MKKIEYPLIKPYLTKDVVRNIEKVLNSGWLTQGKYVQALEKEVRRYLKGHYALAFNSATSGILAVLKSLNLSRKDEVVVPSFTFPATANAVILAGAKPVFCDIDLCTFNMSPEKLKEAITKNTKVIIPVHLFGLAANMEKIKKITKAHKLFIVEDAACALGAEFKKRKVGLLGDASVFSFHPRKIITSGEGGCVVTNSSFIYRNIGKLRSHGEVDGEFISGGYNFRLTDIQAAMLLPQFKMVERIIAKRIKLANNYNKLLKFLSEKNILKTPFCPLNHRHTYQSYVVLLSKHINRDKIKSCLKRKGIETQFGTYCVPLVDFYRTNFAIPKNCYKNAQYAYKHTLVLPLYHDLKIEEQKNIIGELEKTIKKCAG